MTNPTELITNGESQTVEFKTSFQKEVIVLNNFMVPKLKSKKILTIEEIRESILNINNQKISNCYLFGSYAKNRANLFSDIDILFIFDEVIIYWYAKAELTLMDKQHSLNEYSLYYIYHHLLNIKLDTKQIYFLNLSNRYRDFYTKETYIEDIENPQGYFDIMLKLIDKKEAE